MNNTKKLTTISIIAMAILLILFGVIIVCDNAKADDADSKKIADYEYQMNELRKQKEKCYDNLSYDDSIKARDGFIKPCVEWDEQIMEIRAKADELKAKSYDVGLN